MKYKEQFEKSVLMRGEGLVSELCSALDDESKMPGALNALLSFAAENGLSGNLWHAALAQFMLENENPFSLSCERKRASLSSLWNIALYDVSNLRQLFDAESSHPVWCEIKSFTPPVSFENPAISELLEAQQKGVSDEDFLRTLAYSYEKYGCGVYGYSDSFRIEGDSIVPIKGKAHPNFGDLIGYEKQKKLYRIYKKMI